MKKKRLLVRSALAVMAVAAVVAAVTGSASNADPVGDHYVDNLGTGVTAEGFSGGNTNSDCATSTFLEGDYDLWHFVVNQVDGAGNLSWNAGLSVWIDTCGSPPLLPGRRWRVRTSTTRVPRGPKICRIRARGGASWNRASKSTPMLPTT
ncbi:MAG: hypothetical protein EBU67_08540 [Actinobacteria bacterium]|nr:hypothetical protein [Actinomycetota bacterium]